LKLRNLIANYSAQVLQLGKLQSVNVHPTTSGD
jgi:hypothetical protein